MKLAKQKIIIIAVLVGLLLLTLRIGYLRNVSDMPASMNMQASETDLKSDPHAGMNMKSAKEDNKSDPHAGMNMDGKSGENLIMIDPVRLQSIGITYEPARRQNVDKIIRTIGRIEPDERRVAHIHVKFEGWIDKLIVNYTGEKIAKGEGLFTVYSPELFATQQEYLLALDGHDILGKNKNIKAAEGSLDALQAAKQRLLLWDVSEIEIQRLIKTKKVSKTITIYSPIDGTVINKTAYAGMKIESGDELYTIASLSSLWIQGDIYEYDLPYIKVDQVADISLDSTSSTSVPHLSAKLDFISPTVDPQTRTIKVRFQVDNKKDELKPGMYVNLELKIPLGERLIVPKDAILLTGERAVIFINHGGGKIEWRDVKLGVRSGDLVEVTEGISEGDQIITSANFLIDSESQLKAAMGGMQH
jgi:Cu(I)/Ag(I) efflux system membrane fusion protein